MSGEIGKPDDTKIADPERATKGKTQQGRTPDSGQRADVERDTGHSANDESSVDERDHNHKMRRS